MNLGLTPNAADRPPRRGRIRLKNETRIMLAAEDVFGRLGYHAATTALVAQRAGMPKANLHYYFKTKTDLYVKLLESIVTMWWQATESIRSDEEPAAALSRLVRAKIELSRQRPLASRIFAAEIVSGAPHLLPFLRGPLRAMVEEKSRVIERWIELGKMDRVDPKHLFFQLWALTQTYADFSDQIAAVLGKRRLTRQDYTPAADRVTRLVLKGIGIGAGERATVARRSAEPPHPV